MDCKNKFFYNINYKYDLKRCFLGIFTNTPERIPIPLFSAKMNEFAEKEQKTSLNHVFKEIICFKF